MERIGFGGEVLDFGGGGSGRVIESCWEDVSRFWTAFIYIIVFGKIFCNN